MGTWALQTFGIALLTSNQSESFNAIFKRPLDMMVISMLRIDQFFRRKIVRGEHGVSDYTLREKFKKHPEEIKNIVLPEAMAADQLISKIKDSRIQPQKVKKRKIFKNIFGVVLYTFPLRW